MTTRALEQRLTEIRTDLMPHFGSVKLIPLGTWAHRGNVELYFKHRYRRFQQPIGTLTEYFAFEDMKAVLRDLRRMKPKELNETEQAVLAGELSRVERHELNPAEMLSERAWRLLSNFSSDEAKRNFEARLELQNHRLGERTRGLIEFASQYPDLRLQVTDYGHAYQERFADQYQQMLSAVGKSSGIVPPSSAIARRTTTPA